jgi:hypothetical protein
MNTKDIESNRQLDMALSNFKATMVGAYLGVCAAALVAIISGPSILFLTDASGILASWCWSMVWVGAGWIGAVFVCRLLLARRGALAKWIVKFILLFVMAFVITGFFGPHLGLGSMVFLVLIMMVSDRCENAGEKPCKAPQDHSALIILDSNQKSLLRCACIASFSILLGAFAATGLEANSQERSRLQTILEALHNAPVIPEPTPPPAPIAKLREWK